MKCAFIVSPSYSGSTLLSMLLAHHPRLFTLGEFLDNRERQFRKGEGDFCSCGERLEACPFLGNLVTTLQKKGMEYSVNFPDTAFRTENVFINSILRAYIRGPFFENIRRMAIYLIPPVRKEINRIIQRNSTLIASLMEQEGSSIYLDSAKNNNRVIFFNRYAHDIEISVIWLIRDGRGVTNSIMKHHDVDVETATRSWLTTQRSVIRTTKMIPPNRLFTLRYEEFCENPYNWLPKVCQALGLDPALLPETYGQKELHLTGNNMRLKGLGEIRVDNKWKTRLSAGELKIFEEIGGDLNRELGY